MYAEGIAVSKNTKNAIKWFRKASMQGHAGAKHSLAELLKQTERNNSSSTAPKRKRPAAG